MRALLCLKKNKPPEENAVHKNKYSRPSGRKEMLANFQHFRCLFSFLSMFLWMSFCNPFYQYNGNHLIYKSLKNEFSKDLSMGTVFMHTERDILRV